MQPSKEPHQAQDTILFKLEEMLNKGFITQDEYEAEKNRLTKAKKGAI